MTLPAVQEDWSLNLTGLKINDPDLPYERFEELCFQLGVLHEAVRFCIGDALLQGEARYGEIAFQAFEKMNLSEVAKREYLRVSERVPRSRRRRDLSWSHHRAVAALEPVEQKEWLKKASVEALSHAALRDALRNGAEPKALSACRCCGRAL